MSEQGGLKATTRDKNSMAVVKKVKNKQSLQPCLELQYLPLTKKPSLNVAIAMSESIDSAHVFEFKLGNVLARPSALLRFSESESASSLPGCNFRISRILGLGKEGKSYLQGYTVLASSDEQPFGFT